MKYWKPLYPCILGWILLMFTQSFFHISMINGLVQLILFGLVVLYPIWKTQTLSYVDIGWPWGLVCIGIVTILMS